MDQAIVALALIAGTVWLAWHLARHPLRECPRCKGSGKLYGQFGRYRTCSRCGGAGEIRGRFGRKP